MNKAIALLFLLLVVGCTAKTTGTTSNTAGTTATDTSTDVLVKQSNDGLNDINSAQQDIDDTTFDDVQNDIAKFDW